MTGIHRENTVDHPKEGAKEKQFLEKETYKVIYKK
jgi:hypothetical protein